MEPGKVERTLYWVIIAYAAQFTLMGKWHNSQPFCFTEVKPVKQKCSVGQAQSADRYGIMAPVPEGAGASSLSELFS